MPFNRIRKKYEKKNEKEKNEQSYSNLKFQNSNNFKIQNHSQL